MKHQPITYAALIDPDRVQARLTQIADAGLVDAVPNSWQLTLGVLRMWHRVLFRPGSIGTSSDRPVRANWRARLLQWRPLRFPFLLAEGAVTPWDFSGLYTSPERLRSHLVAAHHDGEQFIYDLQMLAAHPDELRVLCLEARKIVEHDTSRHRWLRDLTVYEGYHENLLAAVEGALRGELEPQGESRRCPDVSFFAYLRWCARQPETPSATLEAWRGGGFTLSSAQGAA